MGDTPAVKTSMPPEDITSISQAYNMNNRYRGVAIIINNKSFDRKTGMNERTGTDADAANLYTELKALDFEVHQFRNKTCTDMLKVMRDG